MPVLSRVEARFLAACVACLCFVGCGESSGSFCDPACGDFEVCCQNSCVVLSNDAANCGECGHACPSGICQAGMCQDAPLPDGGMLCGSRVCRAYELCCNNLCVNTNVQLGTDGRSDPSFSNCSGCSLACDPDQASACSRMSAEAEPSCTCGTGSPCFGSDTCVDDGGTFRCVNLMNDINNCGEVGMRCLEGESCTAGMCGCGTGARCTSGVCCGGACVDTMTDAAHCGECNHACEANGPTCIGGECVCGTTVGSVACRDPVGQGGFGDPDGDPGESCCGDACVPNDDTNCGGCGVMCDVGNDEHCEVGLAPPFGTGGVCCSDLGVCSGIGIP